MVFGAAGGGHDAEHFLGRIQGGNAGDGQFHRNAAQVISFLLDLAAVGNGIQHHIHFARFQILFAVFPFFMDLLDDFHGDAEALEIGTGAGGADEVVAQVYESLQNLTWYYSFT